MEQLHLELSVEDLTFDEMIAIQTGNLQDAKDILVKCAVDASGKPLDPAVAESIIGQLKIGQVRAVFAEFGERVTEAMQEQLPPTPARKSGRR